MLTGDLAVPKFFFLRNKETRNPKINEIEIHTIFGHNGSFGSNKYWRPRTARTMEAANKIKVHRLHFVYYRICTRTAASADSTGGISSSATDRSRVLEK